MHILNLFNNYKNNLYYSAALFLVALIIARLSGAFIAYASYLFLIFYMKRGPSQILRTLSIIWFFSSVNPALFSELEHINILRYIIIFVAFFLAVLNYWKISKNFNFDNFFKMTFLLSGFIILHSLIISKFPEISILKLISWSITVISILCSWSMITDNQKEENFKWFFGFLSTIILLSTILWPYTEITYNNNGNGFQGILNQPQAFGLTMALFLVLSLYGMRVEKINSIFVYVIIIFAIILLILSKSRTSIITIIFIVFSYINFEFFKNIIKSTGGFLKMPIRILLPYLLLLIIYGFALNSQYVRDFFLKGSWLIDQDLLSIYVSSRYIVIEPMLDNIKNHPFFGIGFGVPSLEDKVLIYRSDFFDLPISAPVEKSLTPLAVIEELGILGFIIFILWIWSALRKSISLGLPSFVMVIFVLVINLAESVLFSVGGMGMLIWIMFGWSLYGTRKPGK